MTIYIPIPGTICPAQNGDGHYGICCDMDLKDIPEFLGAHEDKKASLQKAAKESPDYGTDYSYVGFSITKRNLQSLLSDGAALFDKERFVIVVEDFDGAEKGVKEMKSKREAGERK